MSRIMRALNLTTFLVLASMAGSAFAAPMNFEAKSAYVIHPETGTVLANFNGDERMGPASLTKMLTLYLTFEALKDGKLTLDTMVPVSERAWRTEGSKMFIEVGKPVRVEDLIRGIAIVSGNDACVAISEQLGGTEEGFAEMMNAKAKELGMTNSHFVNANGLPDPNQYTTAHDMATLLTAIFRDFPEYKKYMAEEEFTFNGIKQQNRNGLLRMGIGIDASKTGHTEESGFHLASTAVQNGERLVVVVMGTGGFSGREGETLKAFRTFFAQDQLVTFAKPGDAVVSQVPVWHGTVGTANLTVQEPLKAFVNRTEADSIKLQATYNKPLVAPLAADTPAGELKVTLPSGQTLTAALVPTNPVPVAGFATKWIQSLFNKLGLAK